MSEIPEHPRPRRLAHWINPTGAKKVHSLIDKVYQRKNLEMAWEKVRTNKGAGGVDGQSVADFELQRDEQLDRLHRELRRWSLTRGYLFGDATLDSSGYAAYCGPLLALSMSDDKGFAPPGAVRALLRRFVGARIEHREIAAAEGAQGRIGHFGFFKAQNAALWPYVSRWLDGLSPTTRTRSQQSPVARLGGDYSQEVSGSRFRANSMASCRTLPTTRRPGSRR